MTIIYILLFLIIIMAFLGIMYTLNYNKLQFFKTKIENSESIIDETLRKRYDTLIQIFIIINTNKYTKKDYVKEYEKLKDEDVTNFDFDRKIIEGINLATKLKSDHEEIAKNKEINDLFKELKESNELLTASKNYYNKYTTEFNALIRKIPVNIIAKMHNYKIKMYFDGKDFTDDIINDFKL